MVQEIWVPNHQTIAFNFVMKWVLLTTKYLWKQEIVQAVLAIIQLSIMENFWK